MSTLIIYYSYSGNTKRVAESLAAQLGGELAPLRDAKRPGILKAYSVGCFNAMQGKAWAARPLEEDLASYDRLILLSAVWAGNVPPAVNTLWAQLPAGTALEVKLVSAGGESKCRERLEAMLKANGCTLQSLEDIRAK
ncbi:MAG: flavodoxin domain-containing protein [Oscillospiraceae bacterium]|jgi:flavodoxin|nr:flavodoxin domain-containing protein [Oscillospiraceae bacterium]